jgi:DNA-binding beta-propeller fold protein YncE
MLAWRGVVAFVGSLVLAAPCPAQSEPSALTFEHVLTFGSEGIGEGQFKYLEDFAFTKDGRLLVTDAAHAWVQVFDKRSGKFLARFGGKGEADHNLEKPEGIAIDAEGNVFVADYNTGYVKKYSPTFQWLATFSEYGSEPGQLMKSELMDIRGDRLYIPDIGNHRVSVFSLDGRFLFDFSGPGSAPGRLNVPEAAKFGPDGRLYVTDLQNDRVQVFDAEGAFLATWGRTGSGKGQLKSPSGLAFDAVGNVYVAEIGNDRVQVFTKDGAYLAAFGRRGKGVGEFDNLHGLAVDPETGLLYVGDTGNHRVQVFKIVRPPRVR